MNQHLLLILISGTLGCSSDKAVTIHNSSPAASIVSPVDGTSFESDDSITFEGVILDNEDSPDRLVTSWATDVDGMRRCGIRIKEPSDRLLS